MACVNPAHYRDVEIVNRLTMDPHLHASDGSPCEQEQSDGIADTARQGPEAPRYATEGQTSPTAPTWAESGRKSG